MHLRYNLNLPLNDPILEVGGGGAPHPSSNVLVDRFIGGEGFAQRGRVPPVVGNRAMIQADGKLMPFRNHQFKYVILSHVIEHIRAEDILQFSAELGRVGFAGYVEAPSILYEAMLDVPEHIWYVVCEAGVVHLCEKRGVSRFQPFLSPLFEDADFRAVVEKHASLFFTGMEWHGELRVEVHNDLNDLIAMYPVGWARQMVSDRIEEMRRFRGDSRRKAFIRQLIPPVLLQLKRSISKSVHNRLSPPDNAPVIDWREIVVCPVCHSDLNVDAPSGTIACPTCGGKFSVRDDGIPSFLVSSGG